MTIKEAIQEIGDLNKDTNSLQNYVFCLLRKGKGEEAVFHFRKSQKNGTWRMTDEELKSSSCKRTNKRNKERYGDLNYKNHKYALLKKQNYRCAHCGEKRQKTALTIDHIVSIFDGGTNDIENLQLLCRECHDKKDQHLMHLPYEEQLKR